MPLLLCHSFVRLHPWSLTTNLFVPEALPPWSPNNPGASAPLQPNQLLEHCRVKHDTGVGAPGPPLPAKADHRRGQRLLERVGLRKDAKGALGRSCRRVEGWEVGRGTRNLVLDS